MGNLLYDGAGVSIRKTDIPFSDLSIDELCRELAKAETCRVAYSIQEDHAKKRHARGFRKMKSHAISYGQRVFAEFNEMGYDDLGEFVLGRSATPEDAWDIAEGLQQTAKRNGIVYETMMKHGLKDSEYEGDGKRQLTDEEEREFFDRALLMNTYWAKEMVAKFYLEQVNNAISEFEANN